MYFPTFIQTTSMILCGGRIRNAKQLQRLMLQKGTTDFTTKRNETEIRIFKRGKRD